MNLLNKNIKWFMLVSGVLTGTMFFAAIAPQSALNMIFGDELNGALSEIIVRNWGFLVGVVGLLLIYGAFKPQVRNLVLVVAIATKLVFISLILIYGSEYLAKASVSMVADMFFIILFSIYLITAGNPEIDKST